MNQSATEQNSFASVQNKETVVCPKPRRLGLCHTTVDPSYARPFQWQEDSDSKAGNELLDIILAKSGCGSGQSIPQIASSPPFFSGSPPSRASNPLIQDARFRVEKSAPILPRVIPNPSPSSTRMGGCIRSSFGNNPVVRIEGFDCLDRDRRNRSIPALA